MRLSEFEKKVIVSSARAKFGNDTKVILFGSRANDNQKGGDIDLLIKPEIQSSAADLFKRKIEMMVEMELKMGEQRIDVIIQYPGDNRAIVRTANETGISLC